MRTIITRVIRKLKLGRGWLHPKQILIIAGIPLLIIYLIFAITIPGREYRRISNSVYSDSLYMESFSKYTSLPESIIKEKALKEAWITSSGNNSIGLLVNLKDSTAVLMVKGVPVHTSAITHYRIDGIIQMFELQVYYKLFSRPQAVINEHSTIVKESIIIKDAPKDTIEALQSVYMPDTLVKEPAFIALTTSENIKLVMEQDTRVSFIERKECCLFYGRELLSSFFSNVKQVLSIGQVNYFPEIYVALDSDDVRTIYRALPAKTLIIFYF